MDTSSVSMKEYEFLKQEILDHQRRREQLFLFTVAALGVVLGFGLNEKGIPFLILSFIPYLLIYNFCRTTVINSGHIITIGTYIAHFIESSHKESLRWETAWNENASTGEKSRGYWYNFCLNALIVISSGMIILIWIPDKLEPLELQADWEIVIRLVFIFFHIVSCFFCIIKGVQEIFWSKMNQKVREKWNKHWRTVKDQK